MLTEVCVWTTYLPESKGTGSRTINSERQVQHPKHYITSTGRSPSPSP